MTPVPPGSTLTSGRTLAFERLVLATGIQKGLTVRELDMIQIATHPLLTSAPTVHPPEQCGPPGPGKVKE